MARIRIDLGETENDAFQRARVASRELLSRLKEQHDYSVPRPVRVVPSEPESELMQEPPATPIWFRIVEEIPPTEALRPMISDIQFAVCKKYGISRAEIVSARRQQRITLPRQIAMHLAKTLTVRSFPEIGRRFGGRDHTTVLHAVKKISALIERDETKRAEIDELSSALTGIAR